MLNNLKFSTDFFKRKEIAFAIFFLTAFFSIGFLHPDEHYQILELVNLKLSDRFVDMSIFNWDFHERMRSWFQPFIYFLFFAPFDFLSGFELATMARFFNGLLGIMALSLFIKVIDQENHKKIFILAAFTWFIPFLLVRTSSESLSTSLFLIGYYLYHKEKKTLSGLLMGFSFLARYQMGVAIAPFYLYELYKKRVSVKDFSFIVMALLSTFALGVIIDYWGYKEWTYSPFNYLYHNLVLGRASDFGTDPFYYYLTKPLLKGIPPLSLVVAFFGIKNLLRERHRTMALALLSFLVVHSMISHKEVRFLTFVYIVLSVFSYSYILKSGRYKKLLSASIIISSLVMLKTSFSPAHSRINFYQEMSKHKATEVYLLKESGKFEFTMPFYMEDTIITRFVDSPMPKDYLLMGTNYQSFKLISKRDNCKQVYSQYPEWIESVNFFDWLKRSSFMTLYRCENIN